MNTLHFKYAVEVERCGSITQAAENLFMAQPNLSKSIKELEDHMGFPIFSRTSRGVVPTARGREFLVYARSILSQLQAIETLSTRHDDAMQRFSLSMPRAGYVLACFSQLVDTLDKGSPLDIRVRQDSALRTINDVADGHFQLGVIRFQSGNESAFMDYIRDKSLKCELIWEYDALLLMSSQHPLARHAAITPEDLTPYTEITHGDASVPYLPAPDARPTDGTSRIQVNDLLEQHLLLSRIPDAYVWSTPDPADLRKRYDLIQRRCAHPDKRMKDVLIYPASYQLSALDQKFFALLRDAAAQMSVQIVL